MGATQPLEAMKTIAVLATCLLACVVGDAEPSADAHYLGHYGRSYGYGLHGYGYGHQHSYHGYGYGHSPYRGHYGYAAHHHGKREAEPAAVAEASADAYYGYGGYGRRGGYGYGGYAPAGSAYGGFAHHGHGYYGPGYTGHHHHSNYP